MLRNLVVARAKGCVISRRTSNRFLRKGDLKEVLRFAEELSPSAAVVDETIAQTLVRRGGANPQAFALAKAFGCSEWVAELLLERALQERDASAFLDALSLPHGISREEALELFLKEVLEGGRMANRPIPQVAERVADALGVVIDPERLARAWEMAAYSAAVNGEWSELGSICQANSRPASCQEICYLVEAILRWGCKVLGERGRAEGAVRVLQDYVPAEEPWPSDAVEAIFRVAVAEGPNWVLGNLEKRGARPLTAAEADFVLYRSLCDGNGLPDADLVLSRCSAHAVDSEIGRLVLAEKPRIKTDQINSLLPFASAEGREVALRFFINWGKAPEAMEIGREMTREEYKKLLSNMK